MEENEFFIDNSKNTNTFQKPQFPWYFSLPWIFANILIGSILSLLIFYVGRNQYIKGNSADGYKIAGFIFVVIAWVFNFWIASGGFSSYY